MDKTQILSLLRQKLALGEVTREDLLGLVGAPVVSSSVPPESSIKEGSSGKLIKAFYAMGVVIVVLGVCILVGQNWEAIGFAGRILVTLGIALATYVSAMLFRLPEQRVISQVFFTISASLLPLGAYVLVEQAGADFAIKAQMLTAIIGALIYGTAFWITKRNILILIITAFFTWAYYALFIELFVGVGYYYDYSLYLQWATILLGISYILVAGALKTVDGAESDVKEKRSIKSIMYGLGTLGVLGAGISVGGWFDVAFIAILFGAFYGGVFLKSRAMLVFGALFLMAHIMKLTGEYFADSIGWPLALMIIGFLIIGVGYMTYTLNKKFISAK